MPANLPIKILQQSKDHAWYLVLTNSSVGWVNASDIATVDKRFIYAWQHNQGYIAFKNDHFSIIDNLDVYRFSSRMGAIYPIRLTHLNYYIVNLAIKNINGKAVLISTKINKNSVYKIPLFISPHNIATIANQFINIPYGWGGLYGYRDCSATMKDIFTYFGIWLPENSTQQAKLGGKQINLEKLPNQKKQEIILQQGIPFFTLVHLNGHIMLYLGEKNNQLYVLHNMWGLKTFRLFNSDGRAVVGKTVITPIDFGEGYINVKNSLLDKVVGITLLEENKEPH